MPESEGLFQNRKVQVFLGVFAIIGIILLLSKVFGKSEEEQAASRSRKKTYGKLSYADYVYADMAEALEEALANGITEDEDAVYGVFEKVKNIGDVNKIIEHYGKRRVTGSVGGKSLPQTITAVFSSGEKKKLNKILSGKGIAYEFK